MADDIVKNVNPNIKAVDLGDGTFGIAVVSEQAQDRDIYLGDNNNINPSTGGLNA